MDDPAHLVTDRTRGAFRRGFWTPTRGVRLPDSRHDVVARCAAAARAVGPGIVFSGVTAVELWEGVEADARLLEFTIPEDAHDVRRPGYRCRRRCLQPQDVTNRHGFNVTTPARTLVDLAERMSLSRLVAVGDEFLARGLVRDTALTEVLDRSVGQRGVRKARLAATLLDPRAESPRESMVRTLLIEGGYPCPVPQFEVRDPAGRFIARVDLAYVDLRIAFEYDGEHHLSRESQAKDAWRRGDLAAEGWLIVTVVAEDVRQPDLLYTKANRALQARRPQR